MEDRSTLISAFLETYHLMHRYHMMWYGKNFGGLDPKQGQGRILTALRRMNSIPQRELGFMLDIRPQSLGELLQKLENNGYIRRYQSPTDKRALIVELTEKGETFQLKRPNYDELFVGLNRREQMELKKSLEKVSKQLNDLIEQEAESEFY